MGFAAKGWALMSKRKLLSALIASVPPVSVLIAICVGALNGGFLGAFVWGCGVALAWAAFGLLCVVFYGLREMVDALLKRRGF